MGARCSENHFSCLTVTDELNLTYPQWYWCGGQILEKLRRRFSNGRTLRADFEHQVFVKEETVKHDALLVCSIIAQNPDFS